MEDFTQKPASYYFTETDLKKILLDALDPKQHTLMLTHKRKRLIKEFINPNKDILVGKYITAEQLKYLNKVKEEEKDPEYYVTEDIALIDQYFARYTHSAIKRTQHAIIQAFIGGGFRVQELCDFDAEKGISREDNRIHVLGKGKKWRWVHVSEAFTNFLLGYTEKYGIMSNPKAKNSYSQEYQPLFVNSSKTPFTPRNIQKFMEVLTNKIAGLPYSMHPHLFRHTYAVKRILEDPTLRVEELRADMGHKKITTTQIYFRLADKERLKLAKSRNHKEIKEASPVFEKHVQNEEVDKLDQLSEKCKKLGISVADYIGLVKAGKL